MSDEKYLWNDEVSQAFKRSAYNDERTEEERLKDEIKHLKGEVEWLTMWVGFWIIVSMLLAVFG